jgi:hypothetical protein
MMRKFLQVGQGIINRLIDSWCLCIFLDLILVLRIFLSKITIELSNRFFNIFLILF